ncbi:MAG TPA: TnsA endonuclease N-terminal domain-containing protein [Verrucomicrobiae bacterium]|nr:TnsA endonuclease N-terminal domain-containing protein [Verrucomicrobiae bacterium]
MKEGRGQGRGADYKPWLLVQSFSSLGYSSRALSRKTGREHHLMSNLELDFFLILDLSPRVVDIREQFPLLPVAETMAIAQALGIRHPMDTRTKKPFVLTTDFLVTVRCDPRNDEEARTLKPANELASSRTLEKLEIERHYWRARNVDWAIVTDADISQIVVRNLRWLHPCVQIPQTAPLPENSLEKVDRMLREFLHSGLGLASAAHACDDKLGLEPGTSLSFARHFMASRRWRVNLNEIINPASPLKILNGAG